MAISLISPGASLAPALATLPDATAGGSETAGFADLLSLQMFDLGQLVGAASNADAKGKRDADEPASAGADDPALQLQLLAALPGNMPPAALPAPQTGNTANSNTNPANTEIKLDLGASDQTLQGAQPSITGSPIVLAKSPVSGEALANPAAAGDNSSIRNLATIITPANGNTAASTLPATPIIAAVGGREQAASANLAATPPAETTHNDFLANLNAQIAHQTTPGTHVAAGKFDSVATPLRDAAWAQEFGQRVVWMARSDQQTAQISINPPQLGPVQISLNLNGDQATATFVSPHAEVRQAIEDAMPRLREMLAGAGIDLGQANVGSQLAQQGTDRQAGDAPRFGDDKAILPGDSGTAASAAVSPLKSGRGLVDLFA